MENKDGKTLENKGKLILMGNKSLFSAYYNILNFYFSLLFILDFYIFLCVVLCFFFSLPIFIHIYQLYSILESGYYTHICSDVHTFNGSFYFRLEAEDEDQGIEVLEKELEDVSQIYRFFLVFVSVM